MPVDYSSIHVLVDDVPSGAVASYGMIASLLRGVGPRQAARAMRQAPKGLPWHRIVQSSGAIAAHEGAARQRRLLEKEGVAFKPNGAVDWRAHRWRGPSPGWIARTGADPLEVMEIVAGWTR